MMLTRCVLLAACCYNVVVLTPHSWLPCRCFHRYKCYPLLSHDGARDLCSGSCMVRCQRACSAHFLACSANPLVHRACCC